MKNSDTSEITTALKDLPENVSDLVKGSLDANNFSKKIDNRNALVKMGPYIIPKMHKLLVSDIDALREEAARVVELIADKRSIPFLIDLLDDRIFEIRWIAAEGLVRTGRKCILPLLKSVRDGRSSFFFNKGAHHVLITLLDARERKKVMPLLLSLEDTLELGETAPVEADNAINLLFGSKSNV